MPVEEATPESDAAELPAPSGRRTEGEGNEEPPTLIPPPPPPPTFEHLPDVWVLELSSFQLDEAKGFEPTAATVLNITQDHLDWHGDMSAYIAAKARVFGKHAVMVINRDDPQVASALADVGRIAVRKVVEIHLDRVRRIVKVQGMVNADPSFTQHSQVINGVSDLLVDVFGERGKHARASVGMSSLS